MPPKKTKKEDIKEIKEENSTQRTEDLREIYKKERDQQKEQLSIIKSFLSKNIVITLRSGNKLNGKLESISQYEIVVTISYKPVIIMKHAIDLIELAD